MKNRLYSKEISPKCLYCESGRPVKNGKEVLCSRKGVMKADSKCRKYKYDPLKRKPDVIKVINDFSGDDFAL